MIFPLPLPELAKSKGKGHKTSTPHLGSRNEVLKLKAVGTVYESGIYFYPPKGSLFGFVYVSIEFFNICAFFIVFS